MFCTSTKRRRLKSTPMPARMNSSTSIGRSKRLELNPPKSQPAMNCSSDRAICAKVGPILHILVGDAVNGGRLFGDVYAGVDLAGLDDLLAVGHHLDHRDLDDTVFGGVDAGGFQIEKDDGTFEVQFHAPVFLRNSPRIRSSASAALLRKVSEASFTLSATASPSTSSNVSSTRVQTSSA